MDPNDTVEEGDSCLDSQLWHACAGRLVQMPPMNAKVCYFVQGHIEHAIGNVDFQNFPKVPHTVLCRVEAIKYLADQETDEVFAKIRLVPVANDRVYGDENGGLSEIVENKMLSFAKILTLSDANCGGGFNVPRPCADTLFPRLDYSLDIPAQKLLFKDVHGKGWKFRHIFRGNPKRHLFTTGWSKFVNAKKLIAGDSLVFVKAENGDLHFGVRRAQKGGHENTIKTNGNMGWKRGLKPEYVIQAATLAANGHPFEVVYYPRVGISEFIVKASRVKRSLEIRWCSGMRFQMPFETEDCSIIWFKGTISSVHAADSMLWPETPWKLLQVTWNKPHLLLQNVTYVSPWQVELESSSPPRKKYRIPDHPNLPTDTHLPVPVLSGNFLGPSNPFGHSLKNSPAGMQGARHAQYDQSLPNLPINNSQSGICPACLASPLGPTNTLPNRPSSSSSSPKPSSSENNSWELTLGNSTSMNKNKSDMTKFLNSSFSSSRNPSSSETTSWELTLGNQTSMINKSDKTKSRHFTLFGKLMSPTDKSSSEEDVDKADNSSDESGSPLSSERRPWLKHYCREVETGPCKVFMESKDVGSSLNLSLLDSYEELYRRLAEVFGVEIYDMLNRVIYTNECGSSKQIGDEPFSVFAKQAKSLTILVEKHRGSLGAKSK